MPVNSAGVDGNVPDAMRETHHYGLGEIGRRLWPLLRPHRWRLLTAAALVACVGLAVALQPLLGKYIIDVAIPARSVHLALVAAGVFLAVMFTRMALWFAAMLLVYRAQQAIVFALRAAGFMHLQRLCLSFHGRYPSGFLYERVFGNSINTLGTCMQAVFANLVTSAVGLLFSLGFCLWLSPALTVVILLGGIGFVVAAKTLSGRIYAKTRAANEAAMDIVSAIMDKLRGHKTVQCFALEDRVEAQFAQQLQPAMRTWLASVLENMKLSFITEALGYIITAAVLVIGATLVMRDAAALPLGTLVAFLGYQATLIGMLSAITNMYGQLMGARSAFDQLYTVLDTHSTLIEQPDAVMPELPAPRLSLRGVGFAYDRTPVLQGLDLEIAPGRTTALVGRSGSGKSTIANLLLRLYDPTAGAIELDGHDLRELPLRAYRSLFGVVLQDPYFFDTTIEANLRLVRPDISEAELVAVLRSAGAWEFIKRLSDGLQHRVGEGGGQLSGGQRQRLALARCLLTRSRIVILDEATSALDPESERTVQQGVEALCRERTVVVIAHRLSTIRNADCIAVLDQGRVAEQGSFDELLARGGLFAQLHAIATSTGEHDRKLADAGFA